jgi:hypothetical protein
MRLKLAVGIALVAVACGSAGMGGGVGTPLTIDQLKFKVMDAVGVPIFCDPDFYPIVREGGEQVNADSYYPQIRADAELYDAIVEHEHLPSGDLDEAQKLTLYRAFKRLRALVLTKNGDSYTFEARVQARGSKTSIELVDGSVRVDGAVSVTSRTPSGMPPCPICLAAATLIATPAGDVRVTDVTPGMLVWTVATDGSRVAARVVEVGSMAVPSGHLMVHLRLADGRELLASPGHRTSDGRPLGTLSIGDEVDGSKVTLWELVTYDSSRTYDLLPAGPTGEYWANGIPLSSTLSPGASGRLR